MYFQSIIKINIGYFIVFIGLEEDIHITRPQHQDDVHRRTTLLAYDFMQLHEGLGNTRKAAEKQG